MSLLVDSTFMSVTGDIAGILIGLVGTGVINPTVINGQDVTDLVDDHIVGELEFSLSTVSPASKTTPQNYFDLMVITNTTDGAVIAELRSSDATYLVNLILNKTQWMWPIIGLDAAKQYRFDLFVDTIMSPIMSGGIMRGGIMAGGIMKSQQ